MAGRCLLNARIHPMEAPGTQRSPPDGAAGGPEAPSRPGPWADPAPWLHRAEAICWKGGRIRAIGSNRAVLAVARQEGIAPEDASGLLVLPGFVDAHTHFLHIGVKRNRPALNGCAGLEEALARTASWLAAHPAPAPGAPGGAGAGAAAAASPVIAEGWDEAGWPSAQRPTRAELDALVEAAGTPRRPLVLRRVCGHLAVANSAALRLIRPRWDSDDLVDLESGLLLEQPSLYLNEVLPASPAELDAAVDAACRESHRLGVTAVGDYSQAPYREALQRAARAGRLTVRVASSVYVQQLEEELAAGFRTGRPLDGEAGTGPAGLQPGDWLRDGGLKVFHDGSLGARTAALRAPYDDAPQGRGGGEAPTARRGTEGQMGAGGETDGLDDARSRFGCVGHPHPSGTLNWGDVDVGRLYGRAHAAGVQVHAHAIGDAAIDQALAAFAGLAARSGIEGAGWGENALRHRIEHFELHHDGQLAQAAELGIVASSQPNFVGSWSSKGGMYEGRLGRRTGLNNRFRSLKEAGVRLAFGSDGMPPGPLLGLQAAVDHPDPAQRLEPLEAAWHYTAAAAWSLHWDELGTLLPGRRADLVVLQARDLARPASWRIRETVVDGRTRHKS